MTPEDLADYTERLRRAVRSLDDLALSKRDPAERARVAGKAQGVSIALDYLRSYEP